MLLLIWIAPQPSPQMAPAHAAGQSEPVDALKPHLGASPCAEKRMLPHTWNMYVKPSEYVT